MRKGAKKSTLVAVRNFVIVEITAVGLYFGAGFFAHYARIYRELPIAEFVSFQLAQALFVFGFQTLLVALVFFNWRKEYIKESEVSLGELLVQSENENLEFKTTLRWDVKTAKVNRTLEKAAIKTVAAFLNSQGGTLVLGVDDARTIIGLHQDYATLQRPGADGFQTHFSNVFRSMIGPEFRQYVELVHQKVGEKECCMVRVQPSTKPVYVKDENTEEFFIRTGNGTTSLRLSEVASYVESRFRKPFLKLI